MAWFIVPNKQNILRYRIVCFHYAGGSASVFREWKNFLPSGVELWIGELPGRDSRFSEPLITDITEAANSFYDEFFQAHKVNAKPFVVFGHSLGSLIAYEFCTRATKGGFIRDALVELVVAGKQAPHIPMSKPWVHSLNKPEFKDKMRNYSGTAKEILEHEELFDLLEPRIRADFEMSEKYTIPIVGDKKLDCPITALAGNNDAHADDKEIREWEAYTNNKFTFNLWSGDHFFIFNHVPEVISLLLERLEQSSH